MFRCPYCQQSRRFYKKICSDCETLLALVQKNLGQMGFSQLLDELIATGVDKPKIQTFLKSDPAGQGSILDQVTAELTNNLAEGMGVKEKGLSATDVKGIRQNPSAAVSDKPIDR